MKKQTFAKKLWVPIGTDFYFWLIISVLMKVVFSQMILGDQWDILYRFVLRMMGNSISKMSYSLGYQVKTPQLILAFLPKPIYGGKARLTEKEISKANRLIPLLGMVYIRVISRMRQEIFLSI